MTTNNSWQQQKAELNRLSEPVPRSEVQGVWAFFFYWLALISVAGLLHLAWHWWAG